MNREKVIEEMAKVIDGTWKIATEQVGALPSARMLAIDLYGRGYRKKVYGEWIPYPPQEQGYQTGWRCSLCKMVVLMKYNFCPYCGTLMKGES
jgi:hypothetical protein